jgi:hypothetical protein
MLSAHKLNKKKKEKKKTGKRGANKSLEKQNLMNRFAGCQTKK